jgi:hypothetical protein
MTGKQFDVGKHFPQRLSPILTQFGTEMTTLIKKIDQLTCDFLDVCSVITYLFLLLYEEWIFKLQCTLTTKF